MDRRTLRPIRRLAAICALMLAAAMPSAAQPADAYSHPALEWKRVADGLEFARIPVYYRKKPVETIAALRVDPARNQIRVLNAFQAKNTLPRTIDEWQKATSALAMVNGGQYMADPYLMPCALVICDGQQKGPAGNDMVRGMLVAEPRDPRLAKADLLDFQFDRFDRRSTPYTQGIQHWPILLDRNGAIRVKASPWRANRTVVAKDRGGRILFLNTEGAHFTLYSFAIFLKASNQRPDKGLSIHTAMNLDGGHEANMIVKTRNFSYENYGESGRKNPEGSITRDFFNLKIPLPGVIGIFPRPGR